MSLAPADVRPFYDASLLGLRLLDARLPEPRRFGPDADARWANFRGHLTAQDRLEILLRDGDAEHPGAFSARQVYGLDAVAEDEPFGGEWRGLDDSAAEQALARAAAGAPPAGVGELLVAVARLWGLEPAAIDLGTLTPTTRLLLAGSGAVLATARTFADRGDLSFGQQVGVVAACPGERHLAALAAATLGSRCPALFATAPGGPPGGPWDRAIVSSDATAEAAAAARARIS